MLNRNTECCYEQMDSLLNIKSPIDNFKPDPATSTTTNNNELTFATHLDPESPNQVSPEPPDNTDDTLLQISVMSPAVKEVINEGKSYIKPWTTEGLVTDQDIYEIMSNPCPIMNKETCDLKQKALYLNMEYQNNVSIV